MPALGAALTPGAANLDFERDVRPWLGEEAAVALLAGGAGPQPMLIAAVDDRAAARRTLDRLGARPSGSHAGTRLLSLPPRATAAFAGDHLVIGPAGRRDAARSTAPARTARPRWPTTASTGAPPRSATAPPASTLFATTIGLRRLLDGASGLAGVAGRTLLSPRLEGVHAQVAAEEEGLRATTRVLRTPGARPAAFEPTLADRVPREPAGFLALPGVDALAALAGAAGGAAVLRGHRGRAARRRRRRARGRDRAARAARRR